MSDALMNAAFKSAGKNASSVLIDFMAGTLPLLITWGFPAATEIIGPDRRGNQMKKISITITIGILVFSGVGLYHLAIGQGQTALVVSIPLTLVVAGLLTYLRYSIKLPDPKIVVGYRWVMLLMLSAMIIEVYALCVSTNKP